MVYYCSLAEPPEGIFAVKDFTALRVIKFANELFDKHITPAYHPLTANGLDGKRSF